MEGQLPARAMAMARAGVRRIPLLLNAAVWAHRRNLQVLTAASGLRSLCLCPWLVQRCGDWQRGCRARVQGAQALAGSPHPHLSLPPLFPLPHLSPRQSFKSRPLLLSCPLSTGLRSCIVRFHSLSHVHSLSFTRSSISSSHFTVAVTVSPAQTPSQIYRTASRTRLDTQLSRHLNCQPIQSLSVDI